MSSEAISSRARYKSLSVMKTPMNAEPLRKFIGIATILIYFNVGYCVTIIGPTLLDLIQQTGISWEMMGLYLMERAAGVTIGNAISMTLLARRPLACILFCQAAFHIGVLATQLLIPFCEGQAIVAIVFAIQGVFFGMNMNLCNVLTAVVHGKAAHSWFQALYMSASGAAIIAPIISTPFLSEAAANKQSQMSCGPATAPANMSIPLGFGLMEEIDLRVPYWIIGVPMVIAIVMNLAAAIWTRISRFKISGGGNGGPAKPIKKRVMVIAFFLGLLYFMIDGTVGRYIFSFAVKSSLCMDIKEAAWLTTLFGAAIFTMRGVCTLASSLRPNLVTPVRTLTINHMFLSVAFISILIGRDSIKPMAWIFAFSAGVGASNCFPSLMTLMRHEGADRRMIALLAVAGGIGVTTGPPLVSFLMKDDVAGPGAGFYTVFCVAVHIAILLFGALISSITTPASHPPDSPPPRKNNVSVSFEKDQEDVVVNEHVQIEGCVEEARPRVDEISGEEAGDAEEARLAGG